MPRPLPPTTLFHRERKIKKNKSAYKLLIKPFKTNFTECQKLFGVGEFLMFLISRVDAILHYFPIFIFPPNIKKGRGAGASGTLSPAGS
jgi:hypothetical protein